MNISVKYCGGCNPRYDRPGLLNKLKKEFPMHTFDYANPDTESDFLIVICGCTAVCAQYSDLKAKNGNIVISGEDGYAQIVDKIKEIA